VRLLDLPNRPTTPDQITMTELVDQMERVVIDLSKVRNAGTKWIRLFGRMTVRGKKAGKVVAILGAKDTVKGTADELGLLDKLVFVEKQSEVRKL